MEEYHCPLCFKKPVRGSPGFECNATDHLFYFYKGRGYIHQTLFVRPKYKINSYSHNQYTIVNTGACSQEVFQTDYIDLIQEPDKTRALVNRANKLMLLL
jgi:hypothetical protein